jgi:hypothetical protein
MLQRNDRISEKLTVQADRWPIFSTVPEDYAVSVQPVPYCLIFHPPPQGGLPAPSLEHRLSNSIVLVGKQFNTHIVLKTRTILLG